MSKRPRWIVALALLVGAGALLLAVRLLPSADASRASLPPRLAACSNAPALGPAAGPKLGAFFKIRPQLDASGMLVGQRLYVGVSGQTVASSELTAESSVTGPIDGVIAVTSDDGTSSSVQLVSVAQGCSSILYTSTSIVRRAVIDAA